MFVEILKSKIHCVHVTDAKLSYIGSITIDEDLMDAAGLLPGEHVYVVDNNNGERMSSKEIGAVAAYVSTGRPHVKFRSAMSSSSWPTPQ